MNTQEILHNFLSFFKERNIAHKSFLLACSTGVDSMVLSDLCQKTRLKFSLAHINHGLRGQDSDEDERWLKLWCRKNQLKLYSKKIELSKAQTTLSIQMMARIRRYELLARWMKKYNYHYLLTAHHKDDQIESFLLNLIKYPSLRSLSGMHEEKQQQIRRPLMFLEKKQIIFYAKALKIEYREDASNQEEKYLRNNIRLKVLPQILKINPAFKHNTQLLSERMWEINQFVEKEIQAYIKKNIQLKYNANFLSYSHINTHPLTQQLLFQWLFPHLFSSKQIQEIYQYISHQPQSGKTFISEKYVLLTERNGCLLKKKGVAEKCSNMLVQKNTLTENINHEFMGYHIGFQILCKEKANFINLKNHCLALNKIFFPLKIRTRQQGDKWVPLGHRKSVKISDFLIANKIELTEKNRIPIIEDNKNRILCVGALRMDERFKVEDGHTEILAITIQ